MAKALVVYSTDERATRRAAEEIARGIAGAGRVIPTVVGVEELLAERVQASDMIILGASASAKAAVREMRHLEEILPPGILDRKMVSVFDAGPADLHGAGARTLRRTLARDDPALHLVAPGISVTVDAARRELPEPELSRCRQFGEHLAGLVAARGSP
jgi:flavorubredoxin